MDYAVQRKSLDQITTDCLVVPLAPKAKLATLLPAALAEQVASLIKAGDFTGKASTSLLLTQPAGVKAKRVLLVGTGPTDKITRNALHKWLALTMTALKKTGASQAALSLDMLTTDHAQLATELPHIIRALDSAIYRFDDYRSTREDPPRLKKFTFLSEQASQLKQALKQGQALAAGIALARDLGNRPGNECHPVYLADLAKKMAGRYEKLTVRTLSETQAHKMGMGAFYSVSKGSEQPGQIIVFEYKGGRGKHFPTALVGKGITFDTGGISLKPGAGMDEMKFDMCGAASVFGTVQAICEMDLGINLVAVVAAAENMPDGKASKPGDIVTTLSGQTVEILNTDAEGRLVLCDALTYVQNKYKPEKVIDIATLTGACVVALGSHASAVYSNNDALSSALLEAGQQSGDRGWAMPLWDEYQEQLKSPFADMANIGGPKAGSITAACFLARFTQDVAWAHLDIAGTAWVSGGQEKGATGRPVALLTQFLLNEKGA